MDRIDNSTVEQSRHKFLPPKPELSHLTEEELSIIRNVLKKQENFEKDIEKSTSGLKQTMFFLQSQSRKYSRIHSQNSLEMEPSSNRASKEDILLCEKSVNSSSSMTSRMFCYLCNKRFIQETRRTSVIPFKKKVLNCFRCLNCGNYTCLECSFNKLRCKLCFVKFELARKTGSWIPNCNVSLDIKETFNSFFYERKKSSAIDSTPKNVLPIEDVFYKEKLIAEEINAETKSIDLERQKPNKKLTKNDSVSLPDLTTYQKSPVSSRRKIFRQRSSSLPYIAEDSQEFMSRDPSTEIQMKDEIVNEIFKSTISNWRKNKLTREKSIAMDDSNQNLAIYNEANTNEDISKPKSSQPINQKLIRKDSKSDDHCTKTGHAESQVFSNEKFKFIFQQSDSIEININPVSRRSSSFDKENSRLSDPFLNDKLDRLETNKTALVSMKNALKNKKDRRISMPFVVDSNSTNERLKSIIKERSSDANDRMLKKVSFERLICYQTEIERQILPMYHNKRIKKRKPFRSVSTETPSTLTVKDINNIICQSKTKKLESDLENLAKVIIIEQKKSLGSTIEESSISQDLSQDYFDSLDNHETSSSRQGSSMSFGSDSGAVRQITVGKYSTETNEKNDTETVADTKKKWPVENFKKIDKRLKRLKNSSTKIELYYSKDSDTSDSNSTGRLLYNSPDHQIEKKVRKLPDIPSDYSYDINIKYIEQKFRLMKEGIKQAENNLNSIKQKFYVNQQLNKGRRTTIACNHSLEQFEKVEIETSKSIDTMLNKGSPKLSIKIEPIENTIRHSNRQRSIDYPYIVRKTPNLSDVVRKRMLFKKVTNNVFRLGNESISGSLEKEHIPRAVRKMVIRQDNSIEVSLSRSPKLRQQVFSVDFNEKGFESTQSMQGLITSSQNGLNVPQPGNTERRKTIETCENIFLQSEENTKLRVRTPPSNPHRILLYRDKLDKSIRTNGFGMRLMGGHECEDGSLGCFVTLVIPGGPADNNSIEVGDQILEFNGQSVIDSTYEELRTLQNDCGDYAQLVVQHNNIRYKYNSHTNSPLEVSRHYQTVPRLCQTVLRKRRNLPLLPTPKIENLSKVDKFVENNQGYVLAETIKVPVVQNVLKPILVNAGRLLMQIWNDHDNLKLAITINQASNLPPRSESEQWYTYAIGRVIFYERPVKNFLTTPIYGPSPTWNDTYVFEYGDESIDDISIEVYLHDTQNPDDTRILKENFIGMLILPLVDAALDDEPRWYELREKPMRKNSNASVTFKSSSNESLRQIVSKRKKNAKNQSKIKRNSSVTISRQESFSHMLNPVRKISKVFSRIFNPRRNSESEMKSNILHFDDEDVTVLPRNIGQRRHTEFPLVGFNKPIRKQEEHRISITSNQSLDDIDKNFKSYFKDQSLSPGIGQVLPKIDEKSSYEALIYGDIKLGFLMSKGQLEITIYEVRNLKRCPDAIDSFVKSILRAGTHCVKHKKTQTVCDTTEPIFNCKLRFTANNVLGRRIQVILICTKKYGKSENLSIGESFIQLDNKDLDLSQQTISWYKLYKTHLVDTFFED